MQIVLANPLFRQCDIGAVCMLVAAWVRYAGTARSLSKRGSYALLIIGQVSLPSTFPIDRTLNHYPALRGDSSANLPGPWTQVFRKVV